MNYKRLCDIIEQYIVFDNKNIIDAIKNHTDKMDDCDTKSHLLDVITLFE